jgi:hypothetical protein
MIKHVQNAIPAASSEVTAKMRLNSEQHGGLDLG